MCNKHQLPKKPSPAPRPYVQQPKTKTYGHNQRIFTAGHLQQEHRFIQELKNLQTLNPAINTLYFCDTETLDVEDNAYGIGEIRDIIKTEILTIDNVSYPKGYIEPQDVEEYIEKYFKMPFGKSSKLSDEELEELFNKLPWQKAIVVFIGPYYEAGENNV